MQLFGKYRGVVTDTDDPMAEGRIRVQVPSVSGDQPLGWATACLPVGADPAGWFALPAIGSQVWIEFEEGNPERPIWSGTLWSRSLAADAPGAERGPAATREPNELVLKGPGGAVLRMGAGGVQLANGLGAIVELIGPTVTVNHGALEIT
jgi:hypothetical protein